MRPPPTNYFGITFRRIPFRFHLARVLVSLALYADRAWHHLALSLTLGGVVVIIAKALMAPDGALNEVPDTEWHFDPMATLVVVLTIVALIPLRDLWLLSGQERAEILARPGPPRLHRRTLLFYCAFHVHRAFWKALQASTNQRPVPRSEYPRVLAAQLAQILHFRSPDALLSYLRFNPERFAGEIDAFRQAHFSDQSLARAQLRTANSDERIHDLIEAFQVASHPRLLWDGYEIVTEPGTAAAVVRLQAKLRGRLRGPRALTLLELVDKARAHSLIDLADLRNWYGDGCPEPMPDLARPTDSAQKVARKFKKLVKHLWRKDAPLRVVTAGYSACVHTCVEALGSARIQRACIVETDPYHRRDNRLMSAKLERLGIETYIIGLEEFERQAQRMSPPGGFDIALFGFEVISAEGDVLHPRSTPHPLAQLVSISHSIPVVAAVGEHWKVRILRVDDHEPAFVAVYGAAGLTHVVTDTGYHPVPTRLPLPPWRPV